MGGRLWAHLLIRWGGSAPDPLISVAIAAAESKKQVLNQVQECISYGEDTVGSVSWSPCVSLRLVQNHLPVSLQDSCTCFPIPLVSF